MISLTKRVGLTVAALGLMIGMAGQARASHVWFQNVKINNIALETSSGFTDPTIIVNNGEITISMELYGSADTVRSTFSKDGGDLDAPPITNLSYSGGGTLATPTLLSFTHTFSSFGTFDGRVKVDTLSSFPDYRIPSNRIQVDSRTFAFTVVNTSAVTPVPEPGTMAGGLIGVLLASGAWLRRRRARA